MLGFSPILTDPSWHTPQLETFTAVDTRHRSATAGAGEKTTARKRRKAKRKKAQKAKKAAARQAAKEARAKPTEWEVHQLDVLAHVHGHFRVAAKSALQAYAGHMAQEKEEAANTSKRAARRSAACAAGGGDADGVAESDDDDDAEFDDVRMRLAKLEAMEHGELDWDDDDVYGLGRGQSWSSVDHLA